MAAPINDVITCEKHVGTSPHKSRKVNERKKFLNH